MSRSPIFIAYLSGILSNAIAEAAAYIEELRAAAEPEEETDDTDTDGFDDKEEKDE